NYSEDNESEIVNDEETFTLEPVNPTEINDADPDSRSEITMAAMMNDLNEEQPNTPFRAELLLTFTWKDQANEISNRFSQKIRGSQREKQVRALETCYYLGQLLKKFQDNSKALKEMKNLFKVSLGKRRAYNL
ncbi:25373_t:CDS:1, partial [Gigaspora rosea]